MKKFVCYWDAKLATKMLLDIPGVISAEVFGSVAREGLGRDLDFILLVRPEVSSHFLTMTREMLGTRHLGIFKRTYSDTRLATAQRALGPQLRPVIRNIRARGIKIDLFLFPVDWRYRLEELNGALPHRDPRFMWNLFRDAEPIA